MKPVTQPIIVNEPQLPTAEDVYSKSVVSVYCRGFHNFAPALTLEWRIMAQFVRLCEEIAEYSESSQWAPRSDQTKSEIADVLIVLAQIAWLTGMDPAWLQNRPLSNHPEVESSIAKGNIMIRLGFLARSLRKCKGMDDRSGKMAIHSALRRIARQMHIRAATAGFTDIEAEIARKCAADEERGILHGA